MSGKKSRWRRREAVRAAKRHVYLNKGKPTPRPPFDNDRQNRIYLKAYVSEMNNYARTEARMSELERVYGTEGES